jgi:hypothetical protein
METLDSLGWCDQRLRSPRVLKARRVGEDALPPPPLGDIWTPSNGLRTTGSKNAMLREHSKTSLWRVMFDGSFMAIPIG